MAKLKITETVINSGQQALLSSQMPLEDLLPGVKLLDQAGFYSCEVWGRDSYIQSMQSQIEDPWERLRGIKDNMKKTNLQMTFAGQYLLGNTPVASDLVDYFVKRIVFNGIDIVRVYDPLNDTRNLESAIKSAREESIHVQGGIIYTASDVHTNSTFIGYAKRLEELGVDSICIMDKGELLTPYSTYSLIASLKQEVGVPIQLSALNNTGKGYFNAIKAIEAGIELVDTTLAPFAQGVAFPATETMISSFIDSPYDTALDIKEISPAHEYFARLKNKYIKSEFIKVDKMMPDKDSALLKMPYEVVKYMYYTLTDEQKLRLEDITKEIGFVREKAGSPPMTFPIYRGIVDQAVINVMEGEPYKTISPELKELLKGTFGITPGSIDPGFRTRGIEGEEVLRKSPAESLEPQLEQYRAQLPSKYNEQVEDIFTLAQFPVMAPNYFESRSNRLYKIDGMHADEVSQVHPI